MISEKTALRKIKKCYDRGNNAALNSSIFFRECTEGYRYTLGEKNTSRDFICVTPSSSCLTKLLESKCYNLSHEIESLIAGTACSLMRYGRAYIYVTAEYGKENDENEGNEDEEGHPIIKALNIGEIKGVISSVGKENVEFYQVCFDGRVRKCVLNSSGLVILSIKEMGYRERHFWRIGCKLDKRDLTNAKDLLLGKAEGYNYDEHRRRTEIDTLKLTRELGVTVGINELSDSYYLYRKIQTKRFAQEMLDYILGRINFVISNYLPHGDSGQLVARKREINYTEIWQKYCEGQLTTEEIRKQVL